MFSLQAALTFNCVQPTTFTWHKLFISNTNYLRASERLCVYRWVCVFPVLLDFINVCVLILSSRLISVCIQMSANFFSVAAGKKNGELRRVWNEEGKIWLGEGVKLTTGSGWIFQLHFFVSCRSFRLELRVDGCRAGPPYHDTLNALSELLSTLIMVLGHADGGGGWRGLWLESGIQIGKEISLGAGSVWPEKPSSVERDGVSYDWRMHNIIKVELNLQMKCRIFTSFFWVIQLKMWN